MARVRKADDKPKDSGSLQISVEDFVRTRNSPHTVPLPRAANLVMSPSRQNMTRKQREEALGAVHLLTRPCENVCEIAFKLVRNIMYGAVHSEQSQLIITPQVVTGLATLQSAVSDLSRAYIAHTDTVIGRGNASSLEQLNISNPLSGENGLFGQRGPTPAPTIEAPGENKKRKRAPHDKNAPKRALTPFFLYLQTARQTIATEMGPGKTAKEVQDEGGKRWREMTDEDKKEWQEKYLINFARYKAQMASYKAGEGIPQISDEEAKKIFDDTKKAGKLPTPPEIDTVHAEEEENSENNSEEESDESPEPVKAPPPPKRSKTARDATEKKAAVKQTPVKEIEPVVSEQSFKPPEKKKKGSKKKDSKVAEEPVEPDDTVAEQASPPPKAASPEKSKKSKGKKRKSEAA